MYTNAKMFYIDEILKNQQSQRNFFVIVIKYKLSFSDNYLLKISNKNESFEMQRIIEKFCHLICFKNIIHINHIESPVETFKTNTIIIIFIFNF